MINCVFNGNLPNPARTIAMANLANTDYLQAMYKDSEGRGLSLNLEGWKGGFPPLVIALNSTVMEHSRLPVARLPLVF